jgi:mannitol/fructose-specific phosphotransferase system IIA component (Ntr-type)
MRGGGSCILPGSRTGSVGIGRAMLPQPQPRGSDAMRITEILQPGCVKVPLAATSKQAAIFELSDVLAAAGAIKSADELKQAVWAREMTRTTGIGHGIAIPHGKVQGCPRLVMAMGKAVVPIEFESIDRKPVELIFLLASPLDQTGPHIQALARISRLLTDERFRDAIKSAVSGEDLFALIQKHEAEMPL